MTKKPSISELRKRVKRQRVWNAFTMKKIPCLGLSIAILLSLFFFKVVPSLAFSGKWHLLVYAFLTLLAFSWITQLSLTGFEAYVGRFQRKWQTHCLYILSTVLFFPVGVSFLINYGISRARWKSVWLFVSSFALFVLAFALDMETSPGLVLMRNCAVALQAPLLIAGLMGLAQNTSHRKLLCIVWALSLVLGGFYACQRGTSRHRLIAADSRIWHLFGDDVENAKTQCRLYYDTDCEPLAGLVKHTKTASELSVWDKFPFMFSKAEMRSLHDGICAAAPEFRNHLLSFLQDAPSPTLLLSDEALENSDVADLRDFPENTAARYAARFLSAEMRAHPENSAIIEENNAALIQLRDWIAQGGFSDHKSSAFMIERMRLAALAATLPYVQYSKDEWQALLGLSPDWHTVSAKAMASDYCRFSLFRIATIGQWFDKSSFASFVTKCLDNGIFVWDILKGIPVLEYFLASEAYRAETYEQLIQLTLDTKADYRIIEKIVQETENAEKKNALLFIDSDFCIYHCKMMLNVENQRRMAIIAWDVFDYMKSNHDVFPENLTVLDDIPTDAMNSKPFGYAHGSIDWTVDDKKNTISRQGIVIYSHDVDETLPVWNKAPAYIVIPLENRK